MAFNERGAGAKTLDYTRTRVMVPDAILESVREQVKAYKLGRRKGKAPAKLE